MLGALRMQEAALAIILDYLPERASQAREERQARLDALATAQVAAGRTCLN